MNTENDTSSRCSPFWAIFLPALAVAVFLGWQVSLAWRQRVQLQRLSEQQVVLQNQAVQTERNLQQLSMDLLSVAKKDPAAQAIVSKYRITYNAPANPDAGAGRR